MMLASLAGCSSEQGGEPAPAVYADHSKTGKLSLMIVGDYFHNRYILELAQIARELSPDAQQIIVCTRRYENALAPLLASNGVQNVRYVVLDESSPVFTQWARDVAVAGRPGDEQTVVVSPFKHARTESGAAATAGLLQRILPNRAVLLAPFVFESGNLAFVTSNGRRVLIVGRKVLFDNEVYQTRPWAAGHDSGALLKVMAETFEVDTVVVAGVATERPPTKIYFEYHIDMGMVILSGNQAVVSQLAYGARAEETLLRAIENRHPVVTRYLETDIDPAQLLGVLSERLHTVAAEYDEYAGLLSLLGLSVRRSPVGWEHVLGSMSWTNVLQTDDRVLMPLYPDSLRAHTTSVTEAGGQMTISLDLSNIDNERFTLTGRNADNYHLYSDLGYRVVVVPEYLHYLTGGLHCFVNILE